MSVQNLSVVFGPTLIQSPSLTPNVVILAVKEMQHQIITVDSLIEDCDFIFNPEIVLKSSDTMYDEVFDTTEVVNSLCSSIQNDKVIKKGVGKKENTLC